MMSTSPWMLPTTVSMKIPNLVAANEPKKADFGLGKVPHLIYVGPGKLPHLIYFCPGKLPHLIYYTPGKLPH